MRFLIDAQLPPALCGWLTHQGHEASHVGDRGLLGGTDRDITELAQREGLILVGKDQDFLALRLPDRFALLWLRVGNATNRALTAWLEPRWPAITSLLNAGERLIEVR